MRRRAFVGLGLGLGTLALAGCQATPAQQIAALTPTGAGTAARARQSRRFETSDRALMLQAALGALQDLGFTIDESNAETGVIVGSKTAGAQIRAQVTVRAAPSAPGASASSASGSAPSPAPNSAPNSAPSPAPNSIVRATFQRYRPRPGAMLAVGETLDDPLLYQGFFERVAQSAFLTAQEI
jgi:hypothetical protein